MDCANARAKKALEVTKGAMETLWGYINLLQRNDMRRHWKK